MMPRELFVSFPLRIVNLTINQIFLICVKISCVERLVVDDWISLTY